MKITRNAAILAAVLGAMGAVHSTPPLGELGVTSQSPSSDKQAPPTASYVPAGLQFLADAGARFGRGAGGGCPWPGRTAARSRRSSGAYWSGR